MMEMSKIKIGLGIILGMLVAMPMAAMADTTSSSTSGSAAQAGAISGSGAIAAPQQNISFGGTDIPSHTTIRNTPDVVMPALTASMVECFGSASGGVSVAGFGISLGKTYIDEECQARRNANQAVALGEVAVGYQVMCANPSFFKADQVTKKICKVYPPGMEPKPEQQPTAAAPEAKVDDADKVAQAIAANRSEVAFLAK
jgi:hypothetical protein